MLNSESNLASLMEQPVGPEGDPLDDNYLIGGSLGEPEDERLEKSQSRAVKSSKRSSP